MEKLACGLFGLDRSVANMGSDQLLLLAWTAGTERKMQGKAGFLFLTSKTYWGWVGNRN